MTAEILGNSKCELGEGPAYDRTTDTAWWFDIVGKKLFEFSFGRDATKVHPLPRMASVCARIDGDRQLLAMDDGLYVRAVKDGELTLLAPLEADNPATRSNDGRTHPSGTLWIGTMGLNAERAAGAIYWFNGQEVRTLFEGISIPNSICFSQDGATGYFADTGANTIWQVALDPATGLPIGERQVFLKADGTQGWFDGAVMDSDGVLWSASWGGGAVKGFDGDGKLVKSISVPAIQVSCPCFIGRDASAMIATTAWQGQDEATRLKDPGGGHTYKIDGRFNGKHDPDFVL